MNNYHLLDHDVLPGEHQALLVVLQEDHHISLERIPKKGQFRKFLIREGSGSCQCQACMVPHCKSGSIEFWLFIHWQPRR